MKAITSIMIILFTTAAVAKPVCVTSVKANLHSAPSSRAPVTWAVTQYMPLNSLSHKGQWLEVEDLDGERHWIDSDMVSSKISCVVIKSKTASLRRGPSSKSPLAVIPIADRYTPFKKVDREGEWVLLEDGAKGRYWVHDQHIWYPVAKMHINF